MAWKKWRGTPERGAYHAIWKEAAPELKSGRRTRYRRLSRDEREAERLLRELNRNLDRTGVGLGRIVELAELRQAFIKHLKSKNCRPATLQRYEIALKHLEAMYPDTKAAQLTPDLIDDYKARRLEAGIEASTVNREVGIIKTAARKARRWRIEVQDLADVEKLRADKPAKVAFPAQEIEAMLRHGDTIDRLVVLLGCYFGLRRGEMTALAPRAVELAERKIIVGLNSRTKTGETRAIPMHPRAARHLRFWLRRIGPQAARVLPWAGSGSALTARFKRLRERLGMPDGTIHELRHTFATALKRGNADTKKGQRMTGHTKETTFDAYTHLDVSDLRDAVLALKF